MNSPPGRDGLEEIALLSPTSRIPLVGSLVLCGIVSACGSETPGPDGIPPAPVTDLRVLSADDSSATLRWTAPGDDGTEGTAAAYDVRYSGISLELASWASANRPPDLPIPRAAGSPETLAVSGLGLHSTYYFRLKAVDEAGNWSSPSNQVFVNTSDLLPPAAIADLEIVASTHHSVTLAWTAPGDDGNEGEAVTEYWVFYGAGPIEEWTLGSRTRTTYATDPVPPGGREEVLLDDLRSDTAYTFAVKSVDDGGNLSPLSNRVAFRTPVDGDPPGTVEDLTVTGATLYSANLAWTAPGDDGDEGTVERYELRFAMVPITAESWPLAEIVETGIQPGPAGTGERTTVFSLLPDTLVYFAVRAFDEAGNLSALSNVASVRTRTPEQRLPGTWIIQPDGSGDAPTVQAGIDSALAGDLVLVYPGTYEETIEFRGKNITVRSAGGPDVTTLTWSRTSRYVVRFGSGVGRQATLEGFRITGQWGGVSVFNAEPSILGNLITENTTDFDGGGILCSASGPTIWSPLIRGNTITNNRVADRGGGIACMALITPEIRDNVIEGNRAGGNGGGIYSLGLYDGTLILGNRITANRAGDQGGGIWADHADVGVRAMEISGNLIESNYAGGSGGTEASGGGMWLRRTSAWVHHNTIVGNTGDGESPTYGGGIAVESSDPVIEQNIIALSGSGGGIRCGVDAAPEIRNNLVWRNEPADGTGTCIDWPNTHGNVVADPSFCDAIEGNFRLEEGSPALTHPMGPLGAFPIGGCAPSSSP